MSALPYETGNDLSEEVRSQVVDLLNQRLADAIDLETQAKRALAGALAEFGGHVRRAAAETAAWGDAGSADICTEVSLGVDKWLWFVEAHVQIRPRAFSLSLQPTETRDEPRHDTLG